MLNAEEYLKAAACLAAVVVVLLTLWFASDVFLLAFAGIVLATLLRAATNLISRVARASPGIALVITCLAALALAALFGWLVTPRLNNEVNTLQREIPAAWNQLLDQVHRSGWAADIADRLRGGGLSYRRVGGRLLDAFSGLSSAVGAAVVVFFLGLYFAVNPELYIRGFIRLMPKPAEQRAGEVLTLCGEQLRRWLLAKASLMLFVGAATAAGLWTLQFPLVLSLALLAALLDFIPNIGPILSAIPAALIAFTRSREDLLWVAVLYTGVQVVESYILQPLIQKRNVDLPPSITLLGQVLAGTLFGPLGLILATPMTVVALTLLKTVYVQDILRKQG